MTPVNVLGRSVALVGRAASLLEHGDGNRIDSSDVVIRVNWVLPLKGDPSRIGSRTDCVLHAYSSTSIPANARAHDVPAWRKDDRLGYELARAYGFPGVNPRTGVTAVAMLAQAGATCIYLTGYDFYASGLATATLPDPEHRKIAGKGGGHKMEADRVILAALVRAQSCETDAILAKALA